MWLVAMFACTPQSDDADATPTELPTPPPSASPCDEVCGVVWTGESWSDCEPCVSGDGLEERMAAVDEAIAAMHERSYMADIVDIDDEALRAYALAAIEDEPIPRRGRTTALNRVVQAYRNGHSGLYRTDAPCYDRDAAEPFRSRYGACLEPLEGDFVAITGSTSLGLSPGDRIVEVNGLSGTDLIDWVADGPLCAQGASNDDVRHNLAAHALLGVVREGDLLTVQDPNGESRSILAGPHEAVTGCGADTTDWVSGYQRDDGVAVMRISRWILFPTDPDYVEPTWENLDIYVETMLSQAQPVFDEVTAGATGLIWDIRGNSGGVSKVGFGFAAGMPGATQGLLTTCWGRVPGTDPIQYSGPPLDYEMPNDDRFVFTGPVAALFDGSSVSASDYFAHVLSIHTDVEIFGRPTSGSYGGAALGTPLVNAPSFSLGIDTAMCEDAEGMPLETLSTQPHQWVEPDPADLQLGIDTVMEAAADWIDAEI